MLKGFDETVEALNRLTRRGAYSTMLSDISDSIVFEINVQTDQGKDILTGQPMKPYSVPYAAMRKKLGLQHKRPNLRLSGDMRNSLKANKGTKEVKIFFNTKKGEERAGYNQSTRRFFDVAPKAEADILKIVDKHLDELLGGI